LEQTKNKNKNIAAAKKCTISVCGEKGSKEGRERNHIHYFTTTIFFFTRRSFITFSLTEEGDCIIYLEEMIFAK